MASRTLRRKALLLAACCCLLIILQMAVVNNLRTNTKYPWEHADELSLDSRLNPSDGGPAPIVSRLMDITAFPDLHTPPKAAPFTPAVPHSTMPPSMPLPPDLHCTPAGKDALSAIARARSKDCQDYIRNVSCLAEAGRLYDHSISSLCPLGRDPGITFQHVPYSLGKGPLARVVFLLSVHGRAFRQLKQLFKAIYHSDHYYFIHIDSRSDYLHRKVTEMARGFPNVYLPTWRMATIWGGASLLQMLLKSLEELEYVLTSWNWDFFINLSESDYPIKSNDELVTFLRVHRKNNFVRTHGGDLERFIHKQGLDRTFVECDEHMWRIGERTLPSTIRFDGGSDWIAINRNYSRYLVTTKDHFITTLLRFYQFSLLPAESFFHTVLINGPMCETYIKTNLRVTNWNRKLGCRCQYKDVVDWCGCSPNDYLASDIDKLKISDHNFFARKFEAVVSQSVINLLDAHLYGPYPEATPSMDAYWENVFSAEDPISRPGHSQFSIYQSFLRQFLQHMVVDRGGGAACLSHTSVKDVTVYMKGDRFAGFVVSLVAIRGQAWVDLEVLFTPVVHVVKHQVNGGVAARIQSLEVGSRWDAKESIFRNYGNILGVWDELVMAMSLGGGGGATGEVHMQWEDPTGQAVFTHQMRIDTSWSVAYHKPTLERPLRPGVWRLRVDLMDGAPVIETKFLVFPLTHENMIPLASPAEVNAKMASIAAGREGGVNMTAYQEWKRSVLMEGEDLYHWADGLCARFWTVSGACSAGTLRGGRCPSLPACSSSEWSTLAPDPKSDIGPVQPNGRIR